MLDSYVSIDLETTGLNPKRDKIIEIGAVRVIEGQLTERFSSLVNPGRKLDGHVVELTGIRDEDLQQAPCLEEIFPELTVFLGDSVLLGHSVLFDYSFLKKAAVNQKLSFEKKAVDTLKIARKVLPQLEHRNLGYLCAYYRIPHQPHRALADAEATSRLYTCLARQFGEQEPELFEPKALVYAVKKDTPATKPQKERLYRLLEQHKIQAEYDVEKLTRSEASRFTDKILAKYGR